MKNKGTWREAMICMNIMAAIYIITNCVVDSAKRTYDIPKEPPLVQPYGLAIVLLMVTVLFILNAWELFKAMKETKDR